mgnify:FL=1
MTIDEVIQEYKEEAEEQRKVAKSLKAEEYLFYAQKNEQIVEWLEELKALRQNKKCIPFAIQIDKNYLQKIVDEKLKSIELDIQAIRNKAIDDVMEKCEIQSRVICDAEQQIEYYGLSIRELRNIVAGLKQESEAKNEK